MKRLIRLAVLLGAGVAAWVLKGPEIQSALVERLPVDWIPALERLPAWQGPGAQPSHPHTPSPLPRSAAKPGVP